jgi:GWxTD domain-containing protein
MEAIQAQGDSVPSLDLYLSIPYPSLIFESYAGGFRARYEITLRLSDLSGGEPAHELTWPETTFVEQYETTQSPDPFIVRKRVAAQPGSYRALVTLEDMIDSRKASRVQALSLHDPATEGPSFGRMSLIAGLHEGVATPQISFFVPRHADSMDCVVSAYNLSPAAGSRLELCVLRFTPDSGTAIPPFYNSVLSVPSWHRLVDFETPDTVFRSWKTVRSPRRTEMLDFRIPALPRGLCRLELSAATLTPGGRDTAFTAARYYSVQGPAFPRPGTYREFLDAAAYIARQDEIASLRRPGPAEDERKTFEQFWLSLAGDQPKAAALIRRYYGRVEEANRLFTGAREGWRTDRGMLYCILGPPAGVTNHLDTQTWYYDLGGNPDDNTYLFQRVVTTGQGMTVEDYVLYRRAGYESMWERMVDKWRTGEAR